MPVRRPKKIQLLILSNPTNSSDPPAVAYASTSGHDEMVEFLMSARLLGRDEALRKIDAPTEVEAKDTKMEHNKARTESLLKKCVRERRARASEASAKKGRLLLRRK